MATRQSLAIGIDQAEFWRVCELLERVEATQGAQRWVRVQQVAWDWFSQFSHGDICEVFKLILPDV